MAAPPPTARLRFADWQARHTIPYAALNADAQVRRYFAERLTPEQSAAQQAEFSEHIAAHGFGLWALERKADGIFLGFVGLSWIDFSCEYFKEGEVVEIGWRLRRADWGKGYATEAAKAALRFGFEELALEEIVAVTAAQNRRSERVMQRLGMRFAGEFMSPEVPKGHELARHRLYRLKSEVWRAEN